MEWHFVTYGLRTPMCTSFSFQDGAVQMLTKRLLALAGCLVSVGAGWGMYRVLWMVFEESFGLGVIALLLGGGFALMPFFFFFTSLSVLFGREEKPQY